MTSTADPDPTVSFDAEPGSRRHWQLDVSGVAETGVA